MDSEPPRNKECLNDEGAVFTIYDSYDVSDKSEEQSKYSSIQLSMFCYKQVSGNMRKYCILVCHQKQNVSTCACLVTSTYLQAPKYSFHQAHLVHACEDQLHDLKLSLPSLTCSVADTHLQATEHHLLHQEHHGSACGAQQHA